MEQSKQEGRSPKRSKTVSVSGNFCLKTRTISPPSTWSVNRNMASLSFLINHSRLARLIGAEGFLVQTVASGSVGAGAAAHAYIAKLAIAALAFKIVRVPKLLEHRGIFPDLRQRLLVEVAGQYRQITAGINFAPIRD